MAEEYYYDEDSETAMEKVKRLFRENKVVAAGKTLSEHTTHASPIAELPSLTCKKPSHMFEDQQTTKGSSLIHATNIPCIPPPAFMGASYGVRTGRREFAQHMFRARVGFQFFTLAALLGGGMFYDNKRKEERLALEQSRMVALDQQEKDV
ncbi:hypothetical protein BGZ97_009985 [Linnemannia gamsii]|uniref:HIG1 domain-containing protein n=1 Tax=Linnemannia gamsii TaxID=64522 RepID=A0A9P6R7Q5_9FUNG|nr:hypothetical protein BGZ97_009985 [Linnemannia gamsii]